MSRKYGIETFYLAVNVADHFLSNMARMSRPAPCLLTLAVTSLLIAAKIEEPHSPRFENMTQLLKDKHGVTLSTETLLAFEHTIITTLDFRLRYASPVQFLERYQRLFALD